MRWQAFLSKCLLDEEHGRPFLCHCLSAISLFITRHHLLWLAQLNLCWYLLPSKVAALAVATALSQHYSSVGLCRLYTIQMLREAADVAALSTQSEGASNAALKMFAKSTMLRSVL